VANTLAYYDTATITAVKSFIVQVLGVIKMKNEKNIKHKETFSSPNVNVINLFWSLSKLERLSHSGFFFVLIQHLSVRDDHTCGELSLFCLSNRIFQT
jgi:hypothetical protein